LDIELEYSLSKEELGLFGFSTMLADSIVFDNENGAGYFTFIAEPNPEDNNEIIDKVFTLIIDRSGSMGGTKIEQARDAASFIVNNLNPEDKFNIVDFESGVYSFKSSHVLNTLENRNDALNYIASIHSGGGTNISGALSKAIGQYSNTGGETANIIIFFTDGRASSGIRDTDGILRHVQDEIDNNGVEVTIFSFGIGSGANKQLLTLLATQNKGIAQFLENDQLEESITEFYLKIQSPVLLDTEISFSNSSVTEIYPNPLPSLYQGQQVIVSGRYNSPGNTEIT
jgi:Ca-activated chloride channel family protein